MVKTRGVTPLFGLYRDVLLDRVWFFDLAVLNRVYNLTCLINGLKTCPKQGMVLRAKRLKLRLRGVSFRSLQPGACKKLKERAKSGRQETCFLS